VDFSPAISHISLEVGDIRIDSEGVGGISPSQEDISISTGLSVLNGESFEQNLGTCLWEFVISPNDIV